MTKIACCAFKPMKKCFACHSIVKIILFWRFHIPSHQEREKQEKCDKRVKKQKKEFTKVKGLLLNAG